MFAYLVRSSSDPNESKYFEKLQGRCILKDLMRYICHYTKYIYICLFDSLGIASASE